MRLYTTLRPGPVITSSSLDDVEMVKLFVMVQQNHSVGWLLFLRGVDVFNFFANFKMEIVLVKVETI